jgi:hypothetical protein
MVAYGLTAALPKKTYRTICSPDAPLFGIAVDIQISSREQSSLLPMVLRSTINQSRPEAFNQIISTRGHLPGPDPLGTNSSPVQQNCSVGKSKNDFLR